MKDSDQIGLVKNALRKNEVEAEFKTIKGGIHIFTVGSETYRKSVQIVEACGVRAHWHMLPEDKPLRTVVKDIPVVVEVSQVKEDLVGMGFKIDSVVRLKKDAKNPYDMVAVTTERTELGKKLLEIKNIGRLRVKIESKRKQA